MYIPVSVKLITHKTKSKIFTKFTHIKHKSKTNITQSAGTYTFMKHLREIINQKVIK